MNDAQTAANQQHEDLVLRHTADASHQGRVATERHAGLMDGGFMVRAGDHGIELAAPTGVDGGGC